MVYTNEALAVLLFEDCVAHGDADAMVMLANAVHLDVAWNAMRNVQRHSCQMLQRKETMKHAFCCNSSTIGKEIIAFISGVCDTFFSRNSKWKLMFVSFLQGVSRKNVRLSVLYL